MFDIGVSLWQTQRRETARRSLLVAAGTGKSSAARHLRRAERDVASRSGAGVRRLSTVGQRVGSLSRSAQAALHALDSRSRAESHRAALWGAPLGLDSGAVPGPVAVRRWLRREYPAIRALARREQAEIQRFRCNMISVLTNRGKLAFMVFKGRFTARVFILFLRRLGWQRRRKVFVIVDRHPVHASRDVAHCVKRQKRWLRLFFLPGYSPELNPDEMLNQGLKVKRYFRAPHVRYAAA